jgi:hypothetical protein
MRVLRHIQLSKRLDFRSGFVPFVFIAPPLFIAYQKILEGKFWMLDDHVMINAYEETKTYGFIAKMEALLRLNSVSYLPDDGRLNPTLSLFYASRVLVFGIEPSLYFALNFVILIITSIALLTFLFSIRSVFSTKKIEFFGRIGIAIFTLSLFSIPTIISNYVNLGTSELIGPLFLFVALSTLVQRLFLDKKTLFNGSLLVLSTFLLVGVKENYAIIMFLILISIVLGAFEYFKQDLKVFSLLILITTFFVSQILFVSQSEGQDVYGKDSSLLFSLLSVSKIHMSKYGIAIIIAALLFAICMKLTYKVLDSRSRTLALWPFLIFLSDWLVYRGDIRDRYATNVIVSLLLAAFIIFLLMQVIVKEENMSFIVAIVLCLAVILHQLPISVTVVDRKILATESFEKGLGQIFSLSEKEPSSPVAFVVQSDWDYESIISVGTFLKSRGLQNPLIIELSEDFPVNSVNDQIFEEWSNLGIPGLYKPRGKEVREYITCIYSQNDPSKKVNVCRDVTVIKWLP